MSAGKYLVAKLQSFPLIRRIGKNFLTLINRKLLYPLLNNYILRRRLKSIDNLNIGCGTDYVPGWLNIGIFSELDAIYGKLTIKNNALVLHFDMTE